MTIKKSMIFFDAGNLLGGWWTYCKRNSHTSEHPATKKLQLTKKIDYNKLLKEISIDTDLIRGYFYDAVSEPIDSRKSGFFDMLRGLGVTVVTKKLRHKSVICKHCNKGELNVPYQKGVDVALVTDVMSLANEDAYDIAIIVSGDNDFVDAINYVKSKGKKVWVVSFVNSLGEDTMRSADRVIRLDNEFSKLHQ
jgi:nijmegen breakage syndrome protein 1